MVALGHKVVGPDMVPAFGAGFIVIADVAVPPEVVYDIVAVPAATPQTTPPVVTDATEGFELDHVPPPADAVNTAKLPWQRLDTPVIVGGAVIV